MSTNECCLKCAERGSPEPGCSAYPRACTVAFPLPECPVCGPEGCCAPAFGYGQRKRAPTQPTKKVILREGPGLTAVELWVFAAIGVALLAFVIVLTVLRAMGVL